MDKIIENENKETSTKNKEIKKINNYIKISKENENKIIISNIINDKKESEKKDIIQTKEEKNKAMGNKNDNEVNNKKIEEKKGHQPKEENSKEKSIELLRVKNKKLTEQLNNLLTEIKKEERNILTARGEYDKKLKDIENKLKKQAHIKRNIINKISDLEEQINQKYNNLFEKNNLIKFYLKNKDNNKTSKDIKDEMCENENIEKLIKLKEHQHINNYKKTLLLKKEISKYNKKLYLNNTINENIKKENPLILRKEEELQYLLNNINKQIEFLKGEIIYLKNIEYQHNIYCKKVKEKLRHKLEFIKIEKLRGLEKIEADQKYRHIHEIRKTKIINRNLMNNLSGNKILKNKNEIRLNKIKKSNSLIIKDNSLNNRGNLQKMKISLSPISSTKSDIKDQISFPEIFDNNMYEYTKKIQKLKINNKSNNDSSYMKIKNNYSGIFSKNLFTEEEKSIFKNYNFIPEENINNYEIKYKNMLKKINNLEQKIKNENKLNKEKKLQVGLLIQDNNKRQENFDIKNREYAHVIKINGYKILKMKELINKKNREEKKLDYDYKNKIFVNEKLKKHIHVSHDIQNLEDNDDQSKIQKLFKKQINICEKNISNINENDDEHNEKIEKINSDNNDEKIGIDALKSDINNKCLKDEKNNIIDYKNYEYINNNNNDNNGNNLDKNKKENNNNISLEKNEDKGKINDDYELDYENIKDNIEENIEQ